MNTTLPAPHSLNGRWTLDWLSEKPYTETTEPMLRPNSDSAVTAPVPGYWEDMADLFRTTALHTKLRFNPLYTLQQYPQAGYVPDMALPNPVGCFVYQKTVQLSKETTECPAVLSIGGAQNTVSAWINGIYLGRHEGYSASFSFTIPDGCMTPGENRITLAVSNHRLAGYMERPVSGLTSRAANECTGGIWGDVSLSFIPDGLTDSYVTTAPDVRGFTVHTVGADLLDKTVCIYDGSKCLVNNVIPAGASEVTIPSDGFILWTPETPKLYRAEVTTANQSLTRTFGIRRLTADGTKLYLNGEPYYFRGTCEHCYQPLTVHPTRDITYYRHVIRTLKELGFNSIRFHTWVPPMEYMEAADTLGMVLEIESPNNTARAEWEEIVRNCRSHPSVCIYSTGNELQIDDDYATHLRAVSALIHRETDALFSPMSAMRGIEYNFIGDETVDEPFRHNPARLAEVGQFCDVYNSYSNALTSYASTDGTQMVLDRRNAVYGKPLLSHEICIHGTYADLSLEERYRGSRIGQTAFISSVREHLAKVGLLQRAPLYYRNSAAWQRLLRKHCFETVRRCETFAGYDFLGDIDTHWHTFGYCVGMMNEFYELKPGETVQNVLRCNGETVLLADLPSCVNFVSGEKVEIPILLSHYGKTIPHGLLQIRISGGGSVLYRRELRTGEIARGTLKELYRASPRMPQTEKPMKLTLSVSLSGGDTDCENRWDLYVFPKVKKPISAKVLSAAGVAVMEHCSSTDLWNALSDGKTVVLFGTGPFASRDVSYQLSVAGRTNGHLATVIADHPLMEDFPHDGYCAAQFASMMRGSHSAVLDLPDMPHEPIIDIASSYKNAHREALLFEYRVGHGKLLCCTLRLDPNDPAAAWLRERILFYAMHEDFRPTQTLSAALFASLCQTAPITEAVNTNLAMNKNDITV
ncbi:MAG: beta galactosidase jelly roll domain-containing protein [Clostridia bacterium]|nr:beta galactosidase jelly roll domain-containing protein [Clostridia bacterium]